MGHDIGNGYYEAMAASRRYGSSLGGNMQADIIEVGLGMWWVQNKANLPATSPRLNWMSVYRLLAIEVLTLLDQGPAPEPGSNLPVTFQTFLTTHDALKETAGQTAQQPAQEVPVPEAGPRNLAPALDATAISSSPGSARLGASAKAPSQAGPPRGPSAAGATPTAARPPAAAAATSGMQDMQGHEGFRGLPRDSGEQQQEAEGEGKRTRTDSGDGPLFGQPPFGSCRLSLTQLRAMHPHADFHHVCSLVTEAANCLGHAHNHFTEAALMIHHVAMQNIADGKPVLFRDAPAEMRALFRTAPPELQAQLHDQKIQRLV
jgi:hypothetical protein